jgi:lambda family phage tail tape measure protein
MADVKIDMMLVDQGNSVKKKTGDVKELNGELTKSQKLARSAFSGQRSAVPQGPELEDYNKVRGAVGTGAGARDFANQAQGLGGVVRLYATFAANIFAVSSAFQNLQQAANFERLMQASQMMSVRVGTDLNQIGKNLQSATGYAISFEEAMQFTNLGTSAGLAGKQIEELVIIAKGAAAGLGRDVNDSIRRIIQGTAKQEQEILDELGIFIKAKEAYELYAKKFEITGGADALSAQQRVAAYADAVKNAGDKWKDFAGIDDPFSRFIAKGKEALNNILSSINAVVIPILDLVSKSGNAIEGLILLISGTLVKRAIPELKTLLTDIFTFDKVRAKAQADAARLSVVTEYAKTSQELKRLAEERQKLLEKVDTSKASVVTAVGGMAAQASKKGQRAVSGLSVPELTKELFGKKGYSEAKSVLEVENSVLKVLQRQVNARGDQEAKLENFKKLGLITAASDAKNLVLTQKAKDLSSSIFAETQKTLGVKQAILNVEQKQQLLTEKNATLQKQVQGFGLGTGSTATPASIGITGAFRQGIAQTAENAKRLDAVMDAGPITKFKTFGSVLATSAVSLTTVGIGLGAVGRSAAVAGTAIGLLGTAVAGVFSGILAAFGPIMLVFTLWELFGDKILPESYLRAREFNKAQEELNKTFGITGEALNRINNLQSVGQKNSKEYAQNLQVVNRALDSQIEALEKLILEREKSTSIKLKEEAKKATEARGDVFSEEVYGIEQAILALNKLEIVQPEEVTKLTQLKVELQGIANELEKTRNLSVNDRLRKFFGLSVAPEEGDTAAQQKAREAAAEALREARKKTQQQAAATEQEMADKSKQIYLGLANAIESTSQKLQNLDYRLTQTKATNDRIEAIRGYSTQLEIAGQRTLENSKAELEYTRAVQQANLELQKILQDPKTKDNTFEVQQAKSRYDNQVKSAVLTRSQAQLTAKISAENSTLDSVLKQITLKYEQIARAAEISTAKASSMLKVEQARFTILKEIGAYSATEAVGKEQILQRREIAEQYDRAIKQSESLKNKEFDRLQKQFETAGKTKEAEEALVVAQVRTLDVQSTTNKLAEIERDTALEILRINTIKNTVMAKLAEETERIAKAEALKSVQYSTEIQLLNLRKEELDARLSLGTISEEYYDKEITSLNRTIRLKEFNNSLDQINLDYRNKIMSIDARQNVASAFGPVDPAQFDKERRDEEELQRVKIEGARKAYNEQERIKSLTESLTKDQKDLASIYKDTFSSMGDAIVEFARTGKLSFKSLINDMLSQLLRLYTNKIFTQLFNSLLNGGFLPGLGGGGGQYGVTPIGSSGYGGQGYIGGGAAKGAYFYGNSSNWAEGASRFAKGGMFTNSIVSQPTLFRFAKGTGLMGEAGPEAIMPLKRDQQGNLGVRGGGGSVEVVVNNYTTAQAETRETTDSRGNRRIEVVVGDMTAGEVTRGGSSTNRAITNTFGMKPQLIRR